MALSEHLQGETRACMLTLNFDERLKKSGKPLPLCDAKSLKDVNWLISATKPWALQWLRNQQLFEPADGFALPQETLDLAGE